MQLPLVAVTRPNRDEARWPVVGLGAAGAAALVASLFLPWWSFWLYAPQYPNGLELVISLTGVGGDVHEIDLLNHYIGMKHLEEAASFERRFAALGVALVAGLTLMLAARSGRRLRWLAPVPAATLPIAFVADSFYWLYRFGHHLDPQAPLHIGAFTPQMFGNGRIGQFESFAEPAIGFWIAVLGVGCTILSASLRRRR